MWDSSRTLVFFRMQRAEKSDERKKKTICIKFDLRMLKERVNWKPRNKAETNLSDLNLNTQSRNLAKRALELQFKGQY